MSYKLYREIHGHSKDVRSVSEGPTKNTIVSASRDETVRLWTEGQENYTEQFKLHDHKGFVASVASARSKIFSGGQDTKINVYSVSDESKNEHELLYALEGHKAPVCSLFFDDESQVLISGSWDSTARVWKERECVAVLAGHTHTVWAAVALPHSSVDKSSRSRSNSGSTAAANIESLRVLTGSADKKIILWNHGKAEHTFEGHTDCVRALAVLSETEFLSAANDATIRKWNSYTGECLMVYQGHENFIYSMAIIKTNPDMFVTTSEDGTAKIWRASSGDLTQTLLFPTQTIWTARSLSNGDIVTGSSDGVIRVFSSIAERQAPEDTLAAYDQSVQIFLSAAQQAASGGKEGEIGGYKIADLPGVESLNERGKRDGQTRMVRNGAKIELYKWTEETGQWEKVGDVMGAAKPTDGKSMFEGKEFDYVFDIDVEEGRPPLKLPYNNSDDPWTAAHQFLERNMLPSVYIDQIVQFITQNAPNAGRGAPAAAYSDPFTGGGRYVPNSTNGGDKPMEIDGDPLTGSGRYRPGHTVETASVGGSDPFTGGGRYVPGGSSSSFMPPPDKNSIDPKRPRGEHMPLVEPVKSTSVSADALLAKLVEFNNKQTEAKLSDEQILAMEEFLAKSGSESTNVSDTHVKALERALSWPKANLIPVLDVFRLAMLNKSINSHFISHGAKRSRGLETIDHLCRLIANADSPPQFQILVCRVFANTLAGGSEEAHRLLCGRDCARAIVPLIVQCLDSEKAAAQIAAASSLANLSWIYMSKTSSNNKEIGEAKLDTLRTLIECLKKARRESIDYGSLDAEAVFRLLQAVCTWMWGDEGALAVGRAMRMNELLARLKDATEEERSKAIARSIERMLGI